MRPRSDRSRPYCSADHCDVEVNELEKYCAAHDWRIVKWIEESRKRLEQYKAQENGNVPLNQ